jgi:hypothetical protein
LVDLYAGESTVFELLLEDDGVVLLAVFDTLAGDESP